jgi:hypothetical protein
LTSPESAMNERKKRGKKQPRKRSDKRIQCPQDRKCDRGQRT